MLRSCLTPSDGRPRRVPRPADRAGWPAARRRSMSMSFRTEPRFSRSPTASIAAAMAEGVQHAVRIGAEFALDLGARQRVLGRTARMLAAGRERRAVDLDLDHRLHAGQRRIGTDLDLLGRGAPHVSDRRSGQARTARASAPGRAGSPPRCNGRKSARRTSPCSAPACRADRTPAGSMPRAPFSPWRDRSCAVR